MLLRRARGALLRLARRRALAVAIGLLMLAPAAWVEFGGRSWPWWVDGLSLVIGATGAALTSVGVSGPRGDWIDPEP
jgi:hypothetical protein